jgi:hypothetical protein
MGRNSQRTKQGRHTDHKDDAGQTSERNRRPFHERGSSGGIENKLKIGRKTVEAGME